LRIWSRGKIDLTIALAMACQAAQESFLLRTPAGLLVIGGDEDDDYLWQECGTISMFE